MNPSPAAASGAPADYAPFSKVPLP
jgi:hypothetical protein